MSTQTLNPLPPQEPAPRGSATALNIILAVIGVLALLTVGIGAARSAMTTLNSSHVVQTADAKGITALDIQANSGSFELQFTDTTEAVLEVRSTSGSAWALNRSGSTLQVRPPAGWNDFCFFGCTKADNGYCVSGTAPVTCPRAGTGDNPVCVLDLKGRPLCAVNSLTCVACTSNRDCANAGVKGGRCVPCAPCQFNGTTTACFVPFKP